jgi:hypothetical protein
MIAGWCPGFRHVENEFRYPDRPHVLWLSGVHAPGIPEEVITQEVAKDAWYPMCPSLRAWQLISKPALL